MSDTSYNRISLTTEFPEDERCHFSRYDAPAESWMSWLPYIYNWVAAMPVGHRRIAVFRCRNWSEQVMCNTGNTVFRLPDLLVHPKR